METQRVTVRLPVHQIRAIDTFIRLGEFASRSEAVRAAVSRLIEEITERVYEKAETLKKIQQLEAYTTELEKFREK
ncbi:MAG TPA: ribbon-helix-helix protein, CopG family [Thermoplasmatales archaeon]|nr:ribbon-helix-helix domain-containing protein [Candidatus Thermoplasmatota archaeon]MDD5778430.1 ribbon-helix-helix domain-containing protein [Candidatus Thermoplasmatota archaeon]HDS59304.1 ribbon-helix-helix protein, CopG family [Thermoplasmatales archaeon]